MFRPLGDGIFAKRVKRDSKTPMGIIVPDTAQEKPMEAIVLAVGPGRYENGARIPVSVKEGDRIVFGRWAGKDIKLNNEEFVLVTEDEVIGILK